MSAIVLSRVTCRFGEVCAVDCLDLAVEEREFVTLLGPSGCGKTTTLRMIAGLEDPTEGRIEIMGETVFDSAAGINIPANRRRVGLLFQNYALWPNMTVYRNVAYPLTGTLPAGEIDRIVRETAAMVKIEDLLDRYPAQLSGGQQQRVAIARTLAPRPKVILMDEPLSNLDARLRLDMRAELQQLHLVTDCTFLYVTHDQLEAMTLATRICLMESGVMRQAAPPLTVYRRPANLFVASFVGAPPINLLDCEKISSDGDALSLGLSGGRRCVFRLAERAGEATGNEFVLGIRPEMLTFGDAGLAGEIYSVQPAGMETTVQVRAGDEILTAVVFGAFDGAIGNAAHLSCRGRDVLLFRRDDGSLAGAGELEFE